MENKKANSDSLVDVFGAEKPSYTEIIGGVSKQYIFDLFKSRFPNNEIRITPHLKIFTDTDYKDFDINFSCYAGIISGAPSYDVSGKLSKLANFGTFVLNPNEFFISEEVHLDAAEAPLMFYGWIVAVVE